SEFTGRTSLIRTPLKDVLPVMPGPGSVESEASPMASEAGQKHPILKGLPGVNAKPGDDASWGPWDHTTEAALKSGTAILQTPDGKPLLVLDKPGKGRSAILLSESLPLWTDGYKGGGPSEKLISQVAHWLMQNPDLEEEALNVKLTQDGEKLRIERRSMAEAVDPVILQGPDGKDISVSLTQAEPGLWSAEIPVGGNGVYQVRQDGAAEGQQSLIAFTHKGPANLMELQQAVSTDALIKPLANATGGRTERMAGLKTPRIEFGEYAQGDILHIRENQKTEVKGREDMPLIHPLLGGFLIAAFAAWGWVREGDPKRIQALKDALWRRKDKPAPQGPDADGGVA
ncbi:MAG TPA: hypothetical protein PLO23_01025, partial [Alphaproteobacteria bacterium]|nr:hypothetical protein [Alphaproteobacteria bacterium]